ATTPGKVVFQNELMQLIQYAPSTETVFKRPLLVMPPWINKYYILDLREKNSFVRWAVEQGHTVFVISWVNPDGRYAGKTFENYLFDGPLAALGAIGQATGENEVNIIGYCLGGTLLGATLAWMAQKNDRRAASATFFASLLDFSIPGELGVFIDEAQVENLERRMQERGYLEGSEMAATFNMLRANDLVWSFVVNNYLLGGSGHIAGIVNPPAAKKYGYWTGSELPESADEWQAGASRSEGSWWIDWQAWIAGLNGPDRAPARVPGTGALQALEDAPGS